MKYGRFSGLRVLYLRAEMARKDRGLLKFLRLRLKKDFWKVDVLDL